MKKICLALITTLSISLSSNAQISIANVIGGLRVNTESGSISSNTVVAPCVMGTITNNTDDFLFTEFIKVAILQNGKLLYKGQIETTPSIDAIAPGESFKFRAGGNLEKPVKGFYKYSWSGDAPICKIIDSRSDGTVHLLKEFEIPKSQGINQNWTPFKIITLEEQARKKELERNFAIEQFMNLTHNMKDDREFYGNMKDLDYSAYSANKSQIYKVIEQTISNASVKNFSVQVKDTVYITYDNEVAHNIAITSIPVDKKIEGDLETKIKALSLRPAKSLIPEADTTVTVNSYSVYALDYEVKVEYEDIVLMKKPEKVEVKKGNESFYFEGKSKIDNSLEGNGLYNLSVTKLTQGYNKSYSTEVNKYRNMNASWMIGYQFSTGYPVGMMLGVNNIAYSNWGVYFNWRGNWVGETKSAEELGEVYDISQYIYSSLSFGATLSASKYAYLYGGMGWASKQAEQLPSYNKVSMGAGFNVEAGVIIRPIRWVGASIGYSGSFGKYSHNQLTFGVFLFLQKK